MAPKHCNRHHVLIYDHTGRKYSTVCSRGAEFVRYADVSDDAATFAICSARRGPRMGPVWAWNSQV